MWVGTTTAVIGLAIALALVLGVATMALAAVPGDTFKLGQSNVINAVSALAGNVNNSEGLDATAQNLQVKPGKAPMTVNSAAKVTNLNADKVDGLNSTAFASVGKTVHHSGVDVGTCANDRKLVSITFSVPRRSFV